MDQERNCGGPLDRADETVLRMMLGDDFAGLAGDAGARGTRRGAAQRRGGGRGTCCDGTDTAPATFRLPDLAGVPLAMVYSPVQQFADLYEPEEGLERGTIFAALDFPFYPAGCAGSCPTRR